MAKQMATNDNLYWLIRSTKSQEAYTNLSIEKSRKKMANEYSSLMKKIVNEFEAVYDKLLASVENPTPADLYRLDRYWQAQANLSKNFLEFGDKSIKSLSSNFQEQYRGIYEILSRPSDTAFATLDTVGIEQVINQVWCADGLSWSQRIWNNTQLLQEELTSSLVECLVTGKKTSQLKQELMKRFDVSYHRAEALVRTEMAHLQTEAAKQRYQDYGVQEVEVLVEADACDDCKAMKGKIYSLAKATKLCPRHPNCRCCIVPVTSGSLGDQT